MTNTPTSHQLSPQSNAFEPRKPYTAHANDIHRPPTQSLDHAGAQNQAQARSASLHSPRSTGSPLPWHIPLTTTERDPTAVDATRALNEHYAQKSFPIDEVDHIVERYNEHLGLIQAALDLRDGWSKPQIDAGFLPLPKSDEGDPSNTTVFIGGLSSPIPTDLLRVFFIPFGDIDYVKTPEGKSCGFVRYKRRSDAEHAIKKMQGFELESCRFRLSWGKNPSSHDNRPAPSSTVNPALIGRLASYIDAQHAKELLCCIDVVFDGNTRMFREALEFLGSSVAACSHRNHPDEHNRRGGSYALPIDPGTINPHLSPRTRSHMSATGELPEPRDRECDHRERTAWPAQKPALNAGARVFQHDQGYGTTSQAAAHSSAAPRSHLQRHNSASSDELYPLELEYGPLTPSPPTMPTTFHDSSVHRQAAKTPEAFWSDAEIAPSFYTAGPLVPYSHSPPGIWSSGAPEQSSAHSPYSQNPSHGTQYTSHPRQSRQGYSQPLSISAPNDPAEIASGALRSSHDFARRSSDPADDTAHAPTLAARGHFGSVGQHPHAKPMAYAPSMWIGPGPAGATAAAFNPFSENAFTPLGPLGANALSPSSAEPARKSVSTSINANHLNRAAPPATADGPGALAREVNKFALHQRSVASANPDRKSPAPRDVPQTMTAPVHAGPRAPLGPRASVRA